MGQVFIIFGTLIALNLGIGYWLSEENAESQPAEGVVEVEQVEVAEEMDINTGDKEQQ